MYDLAGCGIGLKYLVPTEGFRMSEAGQQQTSLALIHFTLPQQRRYDMVMPWKGLNVCGMQLLQTSIGLRGIPLPLYIEACTVTGPMDALKVQSSNTNTSKHSASTLTK